MNPNDEFKPERPGESSWPHGDGLDDLLGSDPNPTLSADAVRAIHERLTRESDGALDGLLGLDEVSPPAGLADRVLARVAIERGADRWQRRLRLLPPLAAGVALVAAAVLAIVLLRGGDDRLSTIADDPLVADGGAAADDLPSDDFLAALPALENLEFLIEELDPLEADALFLMDAEDVLFLDLLEMGG